MNVDPEVKKEVRRRAKNVWTASLTELCQKHCKQKFIDIVEERTAERAVLENAVNHVVKALCPFPALKISPWFWETKGGRKVAWAQWKLYGEEALTPSQAARLFWGKANNLQLRNVARLIEYGHLHSYFNPNVIAARYKQTGRIYHSTYVRRSEVLHLIEIDGFEPKKKRTAKKNVKRSGPAQNTGMAGEGRET